MRIFEMAPVRNARVLFNEVPKGYPDPEKTLKYDVSSTIDLQNVSLNGGFLIKTLVLSMDPYLRGRMRDPSIKSYNVGFALGEPISAHGIGVVLRSDNPAIKPGDHVYGSFSFEEYLIRDKSEAYKVIKNEEGLPLSTYIGVVGMPGETAYYGWKSYAKGKAGETVFVSTAAGPVGATVVQLAKSQGLKVIGSAGSEDKVKFLKEIGVDVAFNYKTTSTKEVLAEHGPIDIYWDHVGGQTLEAALDAANTFGRFIICGMISQYNSEPHPIKNAFNILGKSLTVQGFIVGNLRSQYEEEFYRVVPKLVAEGKIKYREDVYDGLEKTGQALYDVQAGNNKGKAVIVVAKE